MPKPEYPPILSSKNWDKKKGVVAKLVVGKTDIGAALQKVEKSFAKVEWRHFDFEEYVKRAPSQERLDSCKKQADDEYEKVKAVISDALGTERQAENVERSLAKNKSVPKDFIVLLERIADGAKKFQVTLGNIETHIKSQHDALSKEIKDQRKGILDGIINKLNTSIEDVDDTKSTFAFSEATGIAHRSCIDDLTKARYMIESLGPLVDKWIKMTYADTKTKSHAELPNLKKAYKTLTQSLINEMKKG